MLTTSPITACLLCLAAGADPEPVAGLAERTR